MKRKIKTKNLKTKRTSEKNSVGHKRTGKYLDVDPFPSLENKHLAHRPTILHVLYDETGFGPIRSL